MATRQQQQRRPFVRFYGIAYPHVLRGDNMTREIRANLADPNSYYRDQAIALSEADLQRFRTLDGKPICLEHDRNVKVGVIHDHWIDSRGKLRINGRIYTDTLQGRQAAAAVQSGNLRGLSVGYGVDLDDNDAYVTDKQFHEVSLCREPFFRGCNISVDASKKTPQKKHQVTKRH